MNYRLNQVYPYPRAEKKNTYYSELLMPLYAGAYGELTAIATYTYQSLISAEKDKRLSDILDCISFTEMKHFKLLGAMIKVLGGDPVLRLDISPRRSQWWDARFSDYNNNPNIFLNNNLDSEIKGLNAYKKVRNDIRDTYICELLNRIIADEEHHIRIFEELLK